MKFKFNKKTTGVAFYNIDNKVIQVNSGNSIVTYTKQVNEHSRIVSAIPFDNILKATVEVPKTIDEHDIDLFLVEAAYKQLSINLEADYKVSYLKVDTNFDADNWVYDVYLVDSRYLDRNYDDLIEKTKYIDVITSICFLPLILYKTDKLDTISNHAFVYIGDNNGIFVLYSKGTLVYAKSLTSSIHKLRVEFNQESSLELNAIEFEHLISGKSGDISIHKPYITSMLNNISGDVDEILMYVKKVYPDVDISEIYFGMSIEHSNHFIKFLKDTFLVDVKPFYSILYQKSTRGSIVLADMAISYASYLMNHPECDFPNFSHIKRPKPLTKRHSWQTVMIAGNLILLSLIYPVYNFSMMGFYFVREIILQNKYEKVVLSKADQYRADSESLRKQIDDLNKQRDDIVVDVNTLRNNMNDIYNWQIGYAQKSKILDDILKVASSSGVKVIKVTSASNNNQHLVVELNIYAKHQKDIADFIKILNEKSVYKSVYTDRVKRVVEDEKSSEQINVSAAPSTISTTSDMEVSKDLDQDIPNNDVSNGDNTDTSNSKTKTDNKNNDMSYISAQVDFTGNEELGRSVAGYLNSIIRVVVR